FIVAGRHLILPSFYYYLLLGQIAAIGTYFATAKLTLRRCDQIQIVINSTSHVVVILYLIYNLLIINNKINIICID
ncbi:MAG: hypothetical protein QF605_02440, partial [Rhodospirillales bacterium]|nr:hypothetical protein [Rhodospirillales bacterium]